MSELPERSQFESRLPQEPAYWNDLAARITDSAEPILRERREADVWWQPLARWSPAIGFAAAAAAAVVAVVGPPTAEPDTGVTFEQMLIAEDPIGQAVLAGGPAATNLSTMLLVQSGGQP
jgi:hypothetical protein